MYIYIYINSISALLFHPAFWKLSHGCSWLLQQGPYCCPRCQRPGLRKWPWGLQKLLQPEFDFLPAVGRVRSKQWWVELESVKSQRSRGYQHQLNLCAPFPPSVLEVVTWLQLVTAAGAILLSTMSKARTQKMALGPAEAVAT